MEPAVVAEEDDTPKIYGNYEVVRVIGKGKFAIVYRAKRISDGEVVALKRINVDAIDPVSREKCLKEIRLLQSLDHPNIIKYLDSFISDNDLVIVIEWAAAGDLKRQIRKAQERGVGFEERLIWKYFSQICDAMQHMHEKRIMHRDLKPANIFLTLDGTIKVGDLGLSRELSEHTLQAHSKVGTPLYMSPEVLRGDGYEFKSDIWSLGCLLYELAMLKSPFKSEGLNLYSLFQKISQGDYQPLPDNYSEQLRSLAYSMISTKSEERPELTTVCQIASQMRNQTARKNSEQATATLAAASFKASAKSEVIVAPESTVINSRGQESGNNRVESRIDAKSFDDKPQSRENRNEAKSQLPPRGAKPATNKVLQDRDYDQDDDDEGEATTNNSNNNARTDSGNLRNRLVDTSKRAAVSATDAKTSDYEDRPTRTEFNNVSNIGASGSRVEGPPARGQKPVPQSEAPQTTWNDELAYQDIHTTTAAPIVVTKAVPYTRPKAVVKHDEEEKATMGKKPSRSNSSKPSTEDELELRGNDGPDIVVEGIQKASTAFALMEILYGKLCVLDYKMHESVSTGSSDSSGARPLLPIHFACDLTQLGRVAGYSSSGNNAKQRANTNEFFQFRRMVDVSVWLLMQLGDSAANQVSNIDVQRDAPMTIAKQLLGAASAAGIPSTELSEVIPTSLLPGYGEKVCTFLLLLCDRALAASGKLGKALVYHNTDSSNFNLDDPNVDDDVGIDEVAEDDEIGRGVSDGVIGELTDCAGEDSMLSLLLPSIDPMMWKDELERVAPALASAARSRGFGNDWGDHFNKMRSMSIIWEDVEESNNNNTGSIPSITSISSMLNATVRDVQNDLRNMARGEDALLRSDSMQLLKQEFKTHKQVAVELASKTEDLSKQVDQHSQKYSQIEEKLEEVSEQLESKIGAEGKGAATGGVIQLKEALKALREESNIMNLQIGLVSANITQRRVTQAGRLALQRRVKRDKKMSLRSDSRRTAEAEDLEGSAD